VGLEVTVSVGVGVEDGIAVVTTTLGVSDGVLVGATIAAFCALFTGAKPNWDA